MKKLSAAASNSCKSIGSTKSDRQTWSTEMKINITIEEQRTILNALYHAEKEALDSAVRNAQIGNDEGCSKETLKADTLGKLSSKIYCARDLV